MTTLRNNLAAISFKRTYSINGQSSAFDDDARQWLANILNQTVRLGGYDAKARVQKLLKQSGPRGVLAEIPQLKSDYVKRIYFNELFAQGQLDADSARQALRLAGSELSSDYEKAQLLVQMSDSYLVNDEMRGIYIDRRDLHRTQTKVYATSESRTTNSSEENL